MQCRFAAIRSAPGRPVPTSRLESRFAGTPEMDPVGIEPATSCLQNTGHVESLRNAEPRSAKTTRRPRGFAACDCVSQVIGDARGRHGRWKAFPRGPS